MDRFYKAIFLSVLLHLLVSGSIYLGSYFSPGPQKISNNKIEIDVINPDKNKVADKLIPKQQNFDKLKQIVRGHEVPLDQLLPKPDLTRKEEVFLSDRTQRVKQQMQAANTGKTENQMNSNPSKGDQAQKADANRTDKNTSLKNVQSTNSKDSKQKVADAEENGREKSKNVTRETDKNLVGLLPQLKPLGSEGNFNIKNAGGNFSKVGEMLPKTIQVGSFTALNTDRFIFANFYERVDDLIRYPWETMVWKIFDQSSRSELAKSLRPYRTDVEVWLLPSGQFHSAHIMRESGVLGFDNAATKTFEQAKMFPNPPKEMIEEDGFIRLRYSFFVRTDAKEMADK